MRHPVGDPSCYMRVILIGAICHSSSWVSSKVSDYGRPLAMVTINLKVGHKS